MYQKFIEPYACAPNVDESVVQLLGDMSAVKKLFSGNQLGIYDFANLDFESLFSENVAFIIREHLELNPGKEITKTRLIDIVMKCWFDNMAIPFMLTGNLPKDGHDIANDFNEFACQLAQEMDLRGVIRVSPTETPELWEQFFNSKNPAFCDGHKACPLLKDGNGYKFLDEDLNVYFRAGGLLSADFENYSF